MIAVCFAVEGILVNLKLFLGSRLFGLLTGAHLSLFEVWGLGFGGAGATSTEVPTPASTPP